MVADPHSFFTNKGTRFHVFEAVFRIRIGLNMDQDPDLAFEVITDPDPGFFMP